MVGGSRQRRRWCEAGGGFRSAGHPEESPLTQGADYQPWQRAGRCRQQRFLGHGGDKGPGLRSLTLRAGERGLQGPADRFAGKHQRDCLCAEAARLPGSRLEILPARIEGQCQRPPGTPGHQREPARHVLAGHGVAISQADLEEPVKRLAARSGRDAGGVEAGLRPVPGRLLGRRRDDGPGLSVEADHWGPLRAPHPVQHLAISRYARHRVS